MVIFIILAIVACGVIVRLIGGDDSGTGVVTPGVSAVMKDDTVDLIVLGIIK